MKRNKSFQYAPRWIVFLIDMFFFAGAILAARIATWILFGENVFTESHFIIASLLILGTRIAGSVIVRTYSGIVRYTSWQDALRIFLMLSAGEILLLLGNGAMHISLGRPYVPYTFLLSEYLILAAVMIASRFIFKVAYEQYMKQAAAHQKVVIIGNGEYAQMVMTWLDNAVDARYEVVAIINNIHSLSGKKIGGVDVYNYSQLEKLLSAGGKIDNIILAGKVISSDVNTHIMDVAAKYGIKVSVISDFNQLIDGTISSAKIHNIKIEDLLNRGSIALDNTIIKDEIGGKAVMVTGAAGSIGSELVRQLSTFRPSRIILVDMAESPLYDIELEVRENKLFDDIIIELCNIRDLRRLENIFKRYRPQVVYHAAAYKHVPMIENIPFEGIKTNIFGTKNVADMAVRYGCEKFVMVSTDKAVNPTNVMGCSKRVAEIYTQTLNKLGKTRFITTRFGNVLGSNGSVIPRFARQIEEGGPITVTHPEITRFFMTIPEACQLVLQASALGEGGEIFVFDMGKSVKIVDLARNMIRLSGLVEGRDIDIVFTGLRPGEKLYEEVLNKEELTLPTPHHLIFRAKVRDYNALDIENWLIRLETELYSENTFRAIRVMKEIVPEYKSNNSVYEQIDIQLREEQKKENDEERHQRKTRKREKAYMVQ